MSVRYTSRSLGVRRFRQLALCAGLITACGDDGPSAAEDGGGSPLDASDSSAQTGDGGIGSDASNGADGADAAYVDAQVVVCTPGATPDFDGDKFTVAAGDCNDCDKDINPAALDVPGNGIDEDCSGAADDEPAGCDQALPLEGHDPLDAARSLGICRRQAGESWGLKTARWVFPDGTTTSIDRDFCTPERPPFPLGHGLLPGYGDHVKPREGASLLALSSGVARSGSTELGSEWLPAYGSSPGSLVQCLPSRAPAGFPTTVAACGGSVPAQLDYIHDGAALELEIKVPSNAHELSFDFNFYSTEFPEYVCEGKSDQFVALLYSLHPATPADHNISFDSLGAVVSVDGAFVRVCEPVTMNGRTFACPLGPTELQGSGMDIRKDDLNGKTFLQGGATSWLTTRAPVVPGETVRLRFAIWDSDDPIGDSTVLVDKLRFTVSVGSATPPVETPITRPIVLL